jgi:SLT domain-containing protein
MNIGQLTAYLGADVTDFERKMAQVEGRMQAMGHKMQQVGKRMSMFVTVPLMAAGGAAFKAASDLQENINKIDAVFKESAKTVHQWSESSIKSMGLAQSSALDAASLFGDMATSMGMPTEAASKMSMSLVQLAADLASFKNIGIDQAKTALAGIFTGETESMKRLGVVMTENALQQWTLSKGMTEYSNKLSEAEKIQIRYAYVMDMTSNAQGDFLRTQSGAANQMRMFKEGIKETAASFGNVLLPILTPIIQRLNDFVKRLNEMSAGGKKTVLVVAGLAAAAGPLLVVLGKIAVGIGVVRKAMVALYTTMLKNPITAAIMALTSLGVVLYNVATRTTELEKSQERMNKATSDAVEPLKREQVEIGNMIRHVTKATEGSLARKKAIDELNARYPELLKNYDQEKITNTDLKKVLNDVNASFQERIKLKAAEALQQAAIDKATKAEMKLIELREEYNDLTADRRVSPRKGNRLRELRVEIGVQMDISANANKEFEKTQILIDKLTGSIAVPPVEPIKPGGGGGIVDQDTLKEQQEAAKKAADDYRQMISELSDFQKTEWDKALDSLDKNYNDRFAIIENYAKWHNKSDEWVIQQKKILDTAYDGELDKLWDAESERRTAAYLTEIQEEQQHREKLLNIRRQYGLVSQQEELALQMEQLKQHYTDGLLNEAEYQQSRLTLASQFGDMTKELNYNNLMSWYNSELAAALNLYADKTILHEEYNEKVKNIDRAYAEWKSKLDKQLAQTTVSFLGDMFQKIGSLYKEGSKQAKAFASLQIIVDTAAAAMKAYKAFADYGPIGVILGAAAAAATIAFGADQLSKVNSAQYQGGATGGVLTKGGLLRVGEQGEELVNLPAGASITPHKGVEIPGQQLQAMLMIYSVMKSINNKIDIPRPNISLKSGIASVTAPRNVGINTNFDSRTQDMSLTTKVSGRDLEIILNRSQAQTKRR